MSESQPASIPPADPNAPVTPPGQTPPPAGDLQPPPKKKKRRWLKILLSLVLLVIVLIVVLIALIPTILSSGSVRTSVVSKINENLNGKIEIQDWAFGWTSGAHINGVKITDADGRQILQLKSLDAPVSFVAAAGGNYDLHKIVIDGLDVYVRREADGTLNFAKLAKPSSQSAPGKSTEPAPPSQPSEPSEKRSPSSPTPTASSPAKIPTINGEIILTNFTGTYDDIGAGTTARAALTVDEKFATADGKVTLVGSGDVTGLEMKNAKAVQFSESDVHLANDLALETGKLTNAKINSLLLEMQGSKALSLSVKGGIDDLDTQRTFQNLTADLTYDAGTLWKMVYPLLSKDTQEQLKDSIVSGKVTKQFVVNGSYPANVAPEEALKQLTASGGIALGAFKGNGIDLQNLVIPFFLKGGKVYLANSDKPGDVAPPASLNGGTISLGGVVTDLGDPHHAVSMPANYQLMKDVSLNATLADMLGKKLGNPLFAGSDTSTGLMSIIVEKCDQVPTDATMQQRAPSNKGLLELNISIQDLTLVGGNIAKLLGPFSTALDTAEQFIGGKKTTTVKGIKGGVRNYKITLANGVTTHDMTIVLGEKRTMHFGGNVNLANMELSDTALTLPLSLFGLPDSTLPNGINVALSGTVTAPKLDAGAAVQKSLIGNANPVDAIQNLIGGKKKKNNAATNPASSGDGVQDGINALQGLIGGNKKK